MIYGYGLWSEIETQLKKELPEKSLRNIQKYNRVKQLIAKEEITPKDLFFFLRFSDGDRRLQHQLSEEGYNLYPNPAFSRFIENRKHYLTEIDKQTKYPLKRVYVDQVNQSIEQLINSHFGNQSVILKVGNLHASEGKWLIDEKRFIPHLKYKMKQMETTIEEFVPNARSIRVGIVGDANKEENYFITEHVNSKTWLKNNAPEEENTYSFQERHHLGIDNINDIIEETKEIALRYETNLIGIDWVVGSSKTGLLELNDMIGLPEGDFAFQLFYREIKRICEEQLQR
jgi:hypothetical protein